MRQYVFVTAGLGIWVIGGYFLMARYYRRIGRSKPALHFPQFDKREWLVLAGLAIAAVFFIVLAGLAATEIG